MQIGDFTFEDFELNARKQVLGSRDTTGKYFVKIEIIHNPNKAQTLAQEYNIIKHLNNAGSLSCPTAHSFGSVETHALVEVLPDEVSRVVTSANTERLDYIIQDFVPDDDGYSLADLYLSMLEQKSLGIYQGDLKPANLRYSDEHKICYIIDYDQATTLTEEQCEMDNYDFLQFCSSHDKERYGIGNWLRHFEKTGWGAKDVSAIFDQNGSFDLGNTTIFQTQVTTNSDTGFYHTIRERDIFIEGSRAVDTRAALLDNLSFAEGERVLDVGCNAGLLSMYLHDRGCQPIGVDRDHHIIWAAKMVANIVRKPIQYAYMDIDHIQELPECDTIMLFSVLHHTKDFMKNAAKVSAACSRIILETRLRENGAQPTADGAWERTNSLQFNTLEELTNFYEGVFPGFQFKTNLGLATKRRYILEFVKS